MILSGRVWKAGSAWVIECPALGAVTEGRSKKDALGMMVDWIQSMLDDPAFKVAIAAGKGEEFTMAFDDPRPILGMMIAQARVESGLTLEEVAQRLGLKSRSNARHYETGKHAPTLAKAQEILGALGYDIRIDLVKKRA